MLIWYRYHALILIWYRYQIVAGSAARSFPAGAGFSSLKEKVLP